MCYVLSCVRCWAVSSPQFIPHSEHCLIYKSFFSLSVCFTENTQPSDIGYQGNRDIIHSVINIVVI